MDAKRTIMKVGPGSYRPINDEELTTAILSVLDEYGRDVLARGGGSPTTTLVTLAVTERIVRYDHGEGVVPDGVVVAVRRVGTLLRKLGGEGKVRSIKTSERELRWWHMDHWNTRTLREEERRNEGEQRNEQRRLYRERWETAIGFEPRDVDEDEVTFTRARADKLLELVEQSVALVNLSRAARGEGPV